MTLSKRPFIELLCVLGIAWHGLGCGSSAGEDEGGGPATTTTSSGKLVNVKGSVKSISGSQKEMAGWILAFVERDTGVAKVAEIDPAGNYTVNGLATTRAQTVALLDPNFRFASVLAMPGDSGTVEQYFTLSGKQVPTMVHRGPTVGFADLAAITMTTDIAADADFDGIPDGMESGAAGLYWHYRLQGGFTDDELLDLDYPSDTAARPLSEEGEASAPLLLARKPKSAGFDTDSDGVMNDLGDPDIDGDGIANWFDDDDDGDTIIDIFDTDANGDSVADETQTITDSYYNDGLEYLALQVIQEVQKDNSILTALNFTAKVRSKFNPSSVDVRGPKTLFEGANVDSVNQATGQSVLTPWDSSLADDGQNEDGGSRDGLYARRVVLAAGHAPKSKQVLFVQLVKKVGGSTVTYEYPYTFPTITTGAVSGSYVKATRVVTLRGTPFVGITDFSWSVHVFNGEGIKVFSSEPVPGTTATYTIPQPVLEAGVKYTAVLIAQSRDKVPSFPAWIIKSASITLQ